MSENKEKAITVTVSHLNSLKPTEIANDDRVKAMFVKNFNAIHQSNMGDQVYEMEKYHFSRAISANKDLRDCTPLSLYACFIEMAVHGLSFDPKKSLVYLIPENVKVGVDPSNGYDLKEKRAKLEIQPKGELAMRVDYGQIRGADNPVFVYEGEPFTVTNSEKGTRITHSFTLPRKGNPCACYMRIIKADGSIDYSIIDLAEMKRLEGYSEKRNGKGNANKLYTSNNGLPDLGFWEAKTMKHAFDAYPKVKLRGQFSQLATDKMAQEEEVGADYGMDITEHTEVNQNNSSAETVIMTSNVDENTGEVIQMADDDLTNF